MMFFDGDLQSGIALAIRDSKYVVCFVKGTDEQSNLWENKYLKDDQIDLALGTRAVTLCINAGSEEAGYLSAYYPVPVVPALIVILHGQLILDLRSGESQDSFKAAILKSLANTSSTLTPPSTAPSDFAPDAESSTTHEPRPQNTNQTPNVVAPSTELPSTSAQSAPPLQTAADENSVLINASDMHQTTSPSASPPNNRSSQTIQNLLADRRRRLEVDKQEKEAAEKAERKAKADARQASMSADPTSAKAKQATYAQQQRKRQHEAKLERERILRQIEHDKAERKEKEEQRKALARAEAEAEGSDGAGGLINQQLSNELSHGPRLAKAKECAIQVRMFDGSTIRNRFPSEQTLRTNVRPWVDKERLDGDLPYTFKQILAPLPNRTLSISEEEESLQSLSLTPSATLVMVPVPGYTVAYSGNQGIVSRGAAAGYNVVSAGAGFVSGALGTFLGLGQATVPAENQTANESSVQAASELDIRSNAPGINIRTLRDQRERGEDHQLYNGNQLNFEPRRDDDAKDD